MVRTIESVLESIRGGLIVSCQTPPGHPLRLVEAVPALAECAFVGRANGLRIDGVADVRAVRRRVPLPIIGIRKEFRDGGRPLITPSYRDCEELVQAGADIVAVEATEEGALSSDEFKSLTADVHAELQVPVMADVSTLAEGLVAWRNGADLIGTTLAGYTARSASTKDGPDLRLLADLVAADVRVVLEGRVHTPGDVAAGFERGAWAVVVGKAITDPLATTERFALVAPGNNLPIR